MMKRMVFCWASAALEAVNVAQSKASRVSPRKLMKAPPSDWTKPSGGYRECLSGPKLASGFAPAAFEIGGAHLGPLQQLMAGAGQRDLAIDQHIGAVGELQRVERVLLD